ncbi:hypothetical protein BJ912DRAFT_1101217 [Pholiota molesta]|nr:hypothetical protein BJ912DRAFT_1101217 [Pholiota molesta]
MPPPGSPSHSQPLAISEHHDAPPTPVINPALITTSSPFSSFDFTAVAPMPSSQLRHGTAPEAGTSKPRCAGPSCKRVGTASCTYKKCKPCCERSVAICMFKGHNAGQRPVSTSDNPSHLARPLPGFPFQVPASESQTPLVSYPVPSFLSESVTPSGLENPSPLMFVPDGFTFKKPVPKALADDYLRRCKEHEIRQKLEFSRAENQRCINHSVVLVAFLDDDTLPHVIPLQDIPTWPTLNLVQVPDLLDLLGISDLLGLELFTPKNGFWTSNLNFAMAVKTDEKIYVRKQGLLAGPQEDLSHTLIPDITPRTSRKHASELSAFSSLLAFFNTFPTLIPLQADAASLEEAPSVDNSTACDDFDRNWDLGFVLTPTEPHVIWPNGMYVRDMAKAFELLASGGSKVVLQDRFVHIFQGKPWKESTYHKNRAFWTKLPLHVRQQAGNLPRTEDGLWTKWRRNQPGWS